MKKIIALFSTLIALSFLGCGGSQPAAEGETSAYPEKVSAYYTAAFMDVKTTEEKLTAAGFEILAKHNPYKNKKLHVLVVTSDDLKNVASKPLRGFASYMRVMVNEEKQEVRATNPLYFLKAYLQADFTPGVETSTMKALETALGTLTPTEDVWEFNKLPEYQFMIGRPYYQDMWVTEKAAASNEELVALTEKKLKKKNHLFTMKLPNGSYIIGAQLKKRTEKFAAKIGSDKALLLPWTILIENGKAYMLKADYYIAISYPLLDLMGFANIMTMPGNIEKAFNKVYKKTYGVE